MPRKRRPASKAARKQRERLKRVLRHHQGSFLTSTFMRSMVSIMEDRRLQEDGGASIDAATRGSRIRFAPLRPGSEIAEQAVALRARPYERQVREADLFSQGNDGTLSSVPGDGYRALGRARQLIERYSNRGADDNPAYAKEDESERAV